MSSNNTLLQRVTFKELILYEWSALFIYTFFFYYGEKLLSDSKTVAINFFYFYLKLWGFNMHISGNWLFLEPDLSGH